MADKLFKAAADATDIAIGCAGHASIYGLCLSGFGLSAEAMILGAVAAGLAHGLAASSSRRAGLLKIGMGTLLAGAGAPIAATGLFLAINFGPSRPALEPAAQALAAIGIGAAWPKAATWLWATLQKFISNKLGG